MIGASDAGGLVDKLEAAVAALQVDDFDVAEACLAEVLAIDDAQIDALHFLGILRHRQGHTDRALALLERARTLNGRHEGIQTNLGNMLYETGRVREAIAAYRASLDLDPTSSAVWSNLGTALHRSGDLAPARFAWEQAVHLDAGNADAWYGLSRTLIELGQVHEGLLANSHAIALWPRHLQAREQVIRALVLLDRREDAARLYRKWLTDEPGNAVARHQLAAIESSDTPSRATDAYVETVFDSFAPHFDSKLAALDYQAPRLTAEALAARTPPEAAMDIADLGCGTGLCGPLLRPWSRRLVGCDLSTGMLVIAKQRNCYDALFKVELVYFLTHERRAFDALVSADTLCYFGPLDEVFLAASGALRDKGCFIFTVEALDNEAKPYQLQPTGRYAHGRRHLETTLREAGFTALECAPVTLRQEAGLPVAGWLVTAGLT